TRHPGLFLDHAPLRQWLRRRARDWRVLNTFAYTGSLSVAAGAGGARQVTTLDLARPAIQWAEENWRLNGFSDERARFIAGDVFEWLPRLKREGQTFDCVILDPPSFSHGKKGNFSTSKDLPRLHALALELLAPGGTLVTSINSAQVSWARFERDVAEAARERRRELEVLAQIDLPETFPTRLGAAQDRYLKGWILRSRA
ncbi:MAG: class I SAM-dependent methyltransferase, partial [Oligoflexia bacterium]|nr:class I SAM-dependent methyltransferase [Oligoflexia bacterium]